MRNLEYNNYHHNAVDRPRVTTKRKFNLIQDENPESDVSDNTRMKSFVRIWKAAGHTTIIGKIFQFVLDRSINNGNGVSENELKEFIRESGAADKWYFDLHQQNKEYRLVFERNQLRVTKIRSAAITYFNSL
jgi:hypothetical protein